MNWWIAEVPDWGKTFRAFSQFHLVVAGLALVVMVGSWVLGLWARGTPREVAFRVVWGWLILIYKVVETIHECLPSRFDIMHSFPLQICDVASFVAAGAMITQRRILRTLLYFWGLGLSTLAFAMPALTDGYEFRAFWLFWISHTMVIGSALYDVVVLRYRPTHVDLLAAIACSLGFVVVVMAIDLMLGLNYGYLGTVESFPPTVIERLGRWPIRVFKLCSMVLAVYVAIWSIWPIGRVLGRKVGRKHPPR